MYAVTKRKTIFPALAGLLLLFATLLPPTAAAQGRTLDAEDVEGWYGGVLGGFPFGFSNTSTSFGADQTRFGWTAVLYGGYRLYIGGLCGFISGIYSASLWARSRN